MLMEHKTKNSWSMQPATFVTVLSTYFTLTYLHASMYNYGRFDCNKHSTNILCPPPHKKILVAAELQSSGGGLQHNH